MASSSVTKNVLTEHFAALKSDVAEAEALLEPMREKRNELAEKLAPIEAEMRELHQQMKAIETETNLFDKKMELSEVAKVLGAKTLSSGVLAQPAPEPDNEDKPTAQ